MDLRNLIELILLFGILQGLLLAIILAVSKRHRKLSNNLLAVFLLSYSFKLWLNTSHSPSIGLGNYLVSILILGPSFYFYVKSVVRPQFKLKVVHLLHLTPAILYLFTVNYFVGALEIKSYEQVFESKQLLAFSSVLQAGVAMLVTGYVIAAVAEVISHKKWVVNHLSDQRLTNLKWLEWLTYFFAIITAFWWMAGYADIAWLIYMFGEPSDNIAYTFWALMSIIVLSIGYYGLLRPEVFIERAEPPSTLKAAKRVTPMQIAIYKPKLLELMDKERPYLDPKLKLTDLADMLSLNTVLLSAVINEGTGKNFNDFINEYRVNEFKTRVESGDHQNFTLLALAYDSGFNSKSTFNAIFKKVTGVTPNQFKNKVR